MTLIVAQFRNVNRSNVACKYLATNPMEAATSRERVTIERSEFGVGPQMAGPPAAVNT
jgi:hypothetical protein